MIKIKLDLDFIRKQYPVFQNPDTASWAMFENAGGSYVPAQVIDRLIHFFKYTKVQPYGLFESSIEAGHAMDQGYDCMAKLLNADEDDLTLGPSTTHNFYVMAHAVRPTLKPGDVVIVTNQDHEANIGCWRRMEEFGVVIKEWQINPNTGELSIDDLKNIVSQKTRLICFTLCSNIVGTMNECDMICDVAHESGALSIGDGVSFAPHRILDVNRSGLDLYCFSTYKTFGPHLGVMWGKKDVMESLEFQGHYFNDTLPHYRFNPTGPLHAEIGALAGIGEYIDEVHTHHFGDQEIGLHEKAVQVFELFAEHEAKLANQLLDALRDLNGIKIIGQDRASPGLRASTISIIPTDGNQVNIVKKLAEQKIAVRNGHFYAYRCVKALGVENPENGVIRISIVHYNTEDEVNRLINGLQQLID